MPRQVILSRKGFDSKAGGKPSFIYKDRLISLPIPGNGSGVAYAQLRFDENTNLGEVMEQVGIKTSAECHLDPDLHYSIHPKRHSEWKAAFGQADIPERVLKKYNVDVGDLFLFYGWFKEIQFNNGRYQYVRNAQNLHVIFGYLEVDDVIDLTDPNVRIPDHLGNHPHVVFRSSYSLANRVYLGAKAGVFNFEESLVLTRKGETRSRWELPAFFDKERFMGGAKKVFLSNGNLGIDFIGMNNQELLISSSPEVINWADHILSKGVY